MTQTILIIDDEQCITDIIGQLLEGAGYNTMTANTVALAKELIDNNRFDVILSDIRMPHGGGKEIVNYCRATEVPSEIFFITGFSDMTDEEIGHLGIETVIPKPLDFTVLLKHLKRVTQ